MENTKELTSLPEKWCIRALNNEQFAIIKPYFQKLQSRYEGYVVSDPDNGWSNRKTDNYSTNIADLFKDGYVEITLEQFRKWVLKEEANSPFKEGQYWRYIGYGGSTEKDIYRIVKINSESSVDLESVNGNGAYKKGEIFNYQSCIIPNSKTWRICTPEEIAKIEPIKQEIPMKEEYWIIISNGEGMHPDDKGKLVIKLENKPSGDISHNYYPGGYYFKFLEDIKYSTREGSHLYGNCGIKMIRKATSEEIERNAPSKKEEDWCIQINRNNRNEIMPLFNEHFSKNDTLWGDENSYYGQKNGKREFSSRIWGKVLTKEEFYAKIGKSIPKKEEENLVGRYVKSIKQFNVNNPVGSYDIIESVNYDTYWLEKFMSVFIKGGANPQFKDYFELMPIGFIPPQEQKIEEKPMETYNVGEWVVVLPEDDYYSNSGKGQAQKINRINTNTRLVYNLDGINDICVNNSYEKVRKALPHEIPGQNTPIMNKFKIGDKVRCIGISDMSQKGKKAYGWKQGLEFVINQITDSDIAWPGINSCGVYFDQLELVNTSSVIPEYVECLSWAGYSHKTGKIYKVTDGLIECEEKGSPTRWDGNPINWKNSTYSAYIAQQGVFNKEDILAEAKRKFPIGCKFHPITSSGKVTNSIYTNNQECHIYRGEDKDWWIIGSANIYCAENGKWAQLIETPVFSEKDALLQQAKLKYPVGTKLNSLGGYCNMVITEKDIVGWNYEEIQVNPKSAKDYKGILYRDGKWAEIVENPKYVKGIDPYEGEKYPYTPDECYPNNVELLSPRKEAKIDTSVNTVNSVEVKLVKPKKVVYF